MKLTENGLFHNEDPLEYKNYELEELIEQYYMNAVSGTHSNFIRCSLDYIIKNMNYISKKDNISLVNNYFNNVIILSECKYLTCEELEAAIELVDNEYTGDNIGVSVYSLRKIVPEILDKNIDFNWREHIKNKQASPFTKTNGNSSAFFFLYSAFDFIYSHSDYSWR